MSKVLTKDVINSLKTMFDPEVMKFNEIEVYNKGDSVDLDYNEFIEEMEAKSKPLNMYANIDKVLITDNLLSVYFSMNQGDTVYYKKEINND